MSRKRTLVTHAVAFLAGCLVMSVVLVGLGAYLVENQVFTPGEDGTSYMVNEQGYEIDRPSTIYIEVDGQSRDITAVRVGGQVVLFIEGTVSL